jgi:hypothetical protein
MIRLTVEKANEVYSILVKYGAEEKNREHFCFVTTHGSVFGVTYIFKGDFGHAGKLLITQSGLRAEYSTERDSRKLQARLRKLNAELRAFSPSA